MASTADTIVQWGLSQIGKTYKSGSQFTHTAYGVAGIAIPRTAIAQAFRSGVIIQNKRLLAPADLVFPTSRIAGLYVGGQHWLTVTRDGEVRRVPVRRVWRGVRVVTPGGGVGLSLAVPGEKSPPIVAGRRNQA